MTPQELASLVRERHPNYIGFTKDAMRVLGDTWDNWGVRPETRFGRPVWELYRREPVAYGCDSSAFFDQETLKRV